MDLKAHTLENVPLADVYSCFHEAFSDYLVPMKISLDQFKNKLQRDGIDFSVSAGASENGVLTALILHAVDNFNGEICAYNGGTGVVPAFRKRKLLTHMYKFILPKLKERGAGKVILEVIKENERAIKAYQQLGFKIRREFMCFRHSVLPHDKKTVMGANIKVISSPDWESFSNWWDFTPSWPNQIHAIERIHEKVTISVLEFNDESIAYAAFVPESGAILQFAVKPGMRKSGFGNYLFQYIFAKCKVPPHILNVDESSVSTLRFLKSLGFEEHIGQYEMEMVI